MTKIVAVGNLKGGVGKTTTAVHLAAALQSRRTDVVLVDADPAGAGLQWCRNSVLPVMAEALSPPKAGQLAPWFDSWKQQVAEFDIAVIDLPPMKSALIAAVFLRADLVLVPCRASALDAGATEKTLAMIRTARRHRSGGLPRSLIIPTMVTREQVENGAEIFSELSERIGPAIPQAQGFVRAAAASSVVTSGLAAEQIERLAATTRRLLRKV